MFAAAAVMATARKNFKSRFAGSPNTVKTLKTGVGKSPAGPATAFGSRPEAVTPPPPARPVQPNSQPQASNPSTVTDAALASIVEVRTPIDPAWPGNSLLALIPTLVKLVVVIGIVFGVASLIGNPFFGLINPFASSNSFAPYNPAPPQNPFFPGNPYQRR